jgi:5-methylcytosine-specific restriction endonuclease McrA
MSDKKFNLLYPNIYKSLPAWIRPRTPWELYAPICKQLNEKPLPISTIAQTILQKLNEYENRLAKNPRSYTPKDNTKKKNVKKKQPLKDINSTEFLQSFEWRRLRYQAIKLSNGRCQCCGASPKNNGIVLHVDHIKPRRKYPQLALTLSNLQVLCESCNHGKGSWDSTDWR